MKEEKNQEIYLKDLNGEPIFRIGLFEGQDYIDFRVSGEFNIVDAEDKPIISGINTNLKWRVKIKDSKPGNEQFNLLLYETFNPDRIDERLEVARKYDPDVTVQVLGGDIYLSDKKINNNTKYTLVSGSYPTELDARKDFKRFQYEFNPSVMKKTTRKPSGTLEFFDAEYENSGEAKLAFKIVPKDLTTKTKLYSIKSFDEILQKEHYRDHVYNGSVEFRLDNRGKLMVVSELPLETYLKRVVYSEIGNDLPLEFSKSLAIVSRSEVLARIGHKHTGDPFDMCNWGHCLRYYGEEFTDSSIDQAVEDTRGQVIFTKNEICDAYFNLICGGHTEDATGVWEMDEAPQFRGKFDWKEQPKGVQSLKKEEDARKWIHSRPDAWCNLRGLETHSSLEKYKKYFRWEVNYTRKELEDIIRKKTSEDIGILFDIVPILRGSSGRLKEIELIGSMKNFRIRGELNIRESLSLDYLESSCFIVEKELDDVGTPISITFVGAGQGHGVGMCKTGAAVMALEGHKWKEILGHYFENCEIHFIYTHSKS